MIKISLTDFVDFVASSGTTKLTKVRTVKYRVPYQPQFDFWKTMRDGILDYHQQGLSNPKYFDSLVAGLADAKKKAAYPRVSQGYKSFLRNRQIQYIGSPSATWVYKQLEIRVNPELLIDLNGVRHLIKLYFKADRLSQQRVAIIQYLLNLTLSGGPNAPVQFGVLDIPRKKLLSVLSPSSNLLPLLQGEALSFETIWNNI